jgi:hypothetical protein
MSPGDDKLIHIIAKAIVTLQDEEAPTYFFRAMIITY